MSQDWGENGRVPSGGDGFKRAKRARRTACGNDWTTRKRFYWLGGGLCLDYVVCTSGRVGIWRRLCGALTAARLHHLPVNEFCP